MSKICRELAKQQEENHNHKFLYLKIKRRNIYELRTQKKTQKKGKIESKE